MNNKNSHEYRALPDSKSNFEIDMAARRTSRRQNPKITRKAGWLKSMMS
jgi:hypothetical protein